MKKLILISLITLFGSSSFAQKKHTKNNNPHKMYYDDYINKYGDDDTSKAIINLFFDKREYCAAGKKAFLPVSVAVTVFAPPIGVGLMMVSTPLFISGVITRKRYNDANLILALHNYQTYNEIPKRLKKKVGKMIKVQQEIFEDQLLEDELAKLKSIKNTKKQGDYILVVK